MKRGALRAWRAIEALGFALLCCVPGRAVGQGRDADVRSAQTQRSAQVEPPMTAYWAQQRSRRFLAIDVALGAFNRVRVDAGMGQPHWLWGGVEVQAATTTEFGALSVGLRGDFLLVNALVQARTTWAYGRHRPVPAAAYDDDALRDATRPRSAYGSLDGSLWGYVPAGPTLGYWEVTASWIPTVSPRSALFDEYMRYTLNRSTAVMGRAAWWLGLWQRRLSVGPAADVVGASGRAALVRVGGSVNAQLTRHMSLQLLFTVPVTSPDPNLDWYTQSWGIARLSWLWASGEPNPGL